jgi:hypothetical protein
MWVYINDCITYIFATTPRDNRRTRFRPDDNSRGIGATFRFSEDLQATPMAMGALFAMAGSDAALPAKPGLAVTTSFCLSIHRW